MSDVSSAPATTERFTAPTARVFVSDADTEEVLRRAFDDVGVHDAVFTKGTIQTAIKALGSEATPRLLVVDVSDVEDPISRVDELAAKCEPEVNVVVIGDRNDIVLYRQLKNAGVTEYFFKPVGRDPIKRVCTNVLSGGYEDKSVRSRGGKLVFVLGVRGGVGATTIAVNTAWRLANKAQRWVALVDMDLENGDAALQLDATPTSALLEALEKPDRVDKLFLERGSLHQGERLDLLASIQPLGKVMPGNDAAFRSLIDKLLQKYRFVFVDLPAAVAAKLIDVLHEPSTCIVVSNGILASARDLVRWRDWLGPNTPERRTLYVLNMAGADGALPQDEFLRAIGQAPDLVIPYSREIAVATNLGIKATQKCAPLDRALAMLLRDLGGEAAAPAQSLLNRIFG